jgi:hypothetical protein
METETHWVYLLAQLTELQTVLKRELRWAGPWDCLRVLQMELM